MTDKIREILGNIELDDFKSFNDKTNSTLEYNRKTENVSRDFSWLPIVEETLPYLDNIIRNPKRFIQQEEDIVIVEKSKKISTETIEHLSQHTNFIQDVDKDGMIKPSKVLNIEKEETWDLYENRFIYTLIKELGEFVRKYTDKDLEEPKIEISNTVNYNGKSAYENEEVDISINLSTFKRENPKDFNLEEMKAKIINVKNIVADFENSSFIKSLAQAIPVKSPIRKTNIILKDTNFQRALALWEYIKNSEIGEPEENSIHNDNLSTKAIKEKFDLTYYLDYISLSDENKEDVSPDILADKILALLEEYIDTTDISEKKLADFVMSEIKSATKRRRTKEKDIENIYNKFIKYHNSYIKGICDMI